MKILLTGAGGFIGSAINNKFFSKYNIISTSREKSKKKDTIKINLEEKYLNQFEECKFDIIIHCASLLANEKDALSLDVFKKNIKITENMITITKKTNPRLFINLSTIAVYPNISGEYKENSIVHPSLNNEGLYGLSKFCSEELLNFSFKETKTKVLNLRLGQTIGKGMRKDRVYSMMKNELKEKNIINVYGNGERTSGFLSINYLLEKIETIINHKGIEGTYNLVENNMSYYDLAKRIIEQHGDNNSSIKIISSGVNSKVKINSDKIEKYLNEE